MSAEQNKARVVELIERVLNGHDVAALDEFTSNAAVLGSGQRLLHAFPDLETHARWIIAEGDMVVVFLKIRGIQQGPWLLVQESTGRPVGSFLMLALRFDDGGQIIDQWVGSNAVEMLAQMGWGFAPVGEVASPPG